MDYVLFLLVFSLEYQGKDISLLPVMGANRSLSLDLAGIARHVQVMTYAHVAT